MGNWLWCSYGSGERLASAVKEGDMAEVKMLLEGNPWLATYSSTFSALNSPLHLAASNAHTHIVMLLLEYGADVNSRNFCGQTALMQACRRGHWEVVQALLLFKPDVTRAEYLSRKTALHFAAAGGHIRCIRLLIADFVPSAPSGATIFSIHGDYKGGGSSSGRSHSSSPGLKCDHSALSRFVNKVADGGVTALHLAALKGHSDCAQLLVDLRANVSAVTHHYGSSPKMIGTGSTPLHFAACGGDLKCCQVLLARGACRLTLNCNGRIPVDVAKMWGHRFLIPLLSPNSDLKVPKFPPSGYLALPLMSVLNIARECRLKSLTASSDENDLCAVCLENTCSVAAEDCGHELCVKCALYLCSTSNITSQVGGPPGSIPCPLCRNGIISFIKVAHTPVDKLKLNHFDSPPITCRSELRQNFMVAVPSTEVI